LEKLKIVHIIQHLNTGGAEKMAIDLAKYCNTKFDVTIICLYQSGGYSFEKIVKENNIKLIFLNKKTGFHIKTFLDLWETLSSIKPDVIHTHMHAAVYALPWLIFHNKNARVHTIHSIAQYELGKPHRLIQKIAYKLFNVVPVAISLAMQKGILNEYNLKHEQVPIINNGIDIQKFSRKYFSRNHSIFTIINVASFSEWKNQSLLIEAFTIALKSNPDLQLVFVGDGEKRTEVEIKAERLNIKDKVEFVGVSSEVDKWLLKADLFVLCSTFEGLPLSIIEAMASGLPVISTDVGGVRDIIEDGVNGLLVPPNNAQELSKAILNLANNKDACILMSEKNINKSKAFDISNIAEQYISLYMKSWVRVNECNR
jgi:glycosyltransferase involved in cell wall biosynthesis